MYFPAFVVSILRLFKLKTEGQNKIHKTSLQSYKTQIKIFPFPGLA